MKLARAVGTVVSTIQAPVFNGRTLLWCDLLDPQLQPTGESLIAVDTVGAGAGEVVLVLDEGGSARMIVKMEPAPIRAVVVGVVDAVELEKSQVAHVPPATARAKRVRRTPKAN